MATPGHSGSSPPASTHIPSQTLQTDSFVPHTGDPLKPGSLLSVGFYFGSLDLALEFYKPRRNWQGLGTFLCPCLSSPQCPVLCVLRMTDARYPVQSQADVGKPAPHAGLQLWRGVAGRSRGQSLVGRTWAAFNFAEGSQCGESLKLCDFQQQNCIIQRRAPPRPFLSL